MHRVISMDEQMFDLNGFDRIWQRVQGAPSRPERDDAAVLRRFLDGTAEAAAFEERLARRTAGVARQLQQLHRETLRRLHMLQTAYFLLTGDTYAPAESCPVQGGILTDLRKDYLRAQERAGQYRAAGTATDREALATLYEELAELEAAHAASLHRLFGQALR